MKYITLEINRDNGVLNVEPLYAPVSSATEIIFLRVILGNVKADGLSAIIKGNTESDRKPLIEVRPTVYEMRIRPEDLGLLRRETETRFKIKFLLFNKGNIEEVESDEILIFRGISFGTEHITDIGELYGELNKLKHRLQGEG